MVGFAYKKTLKLLSKSFPRDIYQSLNLLLLSKVLNKRAIRIKFKKKIWKQIWIFCIVCLLICVSIPLNVSSTGLINSIQKDGYDSGMKTPYMKADCSKILLYQRLLWPAHIGPFWFTSNFSYLCFFIEKDFVLKINGVDQEVELPAMVIPWRFIGLGPLFWIRNVVDPCNGNITLIGICQDVII